MDQFTLCKVEWKRGGNRNQRKTKTQKKKKGGRDYRANEVWPDRERYFCVGGCEWKKNTLLK